MVTSPPPARRLDLPVRAAGAVRRAYVDLFIEDWSPRRWVRARIGGFAFLAFLVHPVRVAFASDWSGPYRALVLLAIATYAAAFGTVIWRNTPLVHANRAPWAIAAALLVGAPLVPVFGTSWLAIMAYFTTSMLLFNCRVRRWPYIVLGVPAAMFLLACLALAATATYALTNAVPVLLVGAIQAAFYQQITAKLQLQRARAELARLAVTEERLRIARDLHDILGQRLSAVSLKAELAARLAPRDPGRAAAEMVEVASVARSALADVRDTVSGYRQMSLCGEIETARALLTAARIELQTTVCEMPAVLGECTGWLVREAVTNVIRHSTARRCEIRAVRVADTVVVEVRDDGGTAGGPVLAYGNGLTGLAERVHQAGGVLSTERDRGWFVVRTIFGETVVRRAAAQEAAAEPVPLDVAPAAA